MRLRRAKKSPRVEMLPLMDVVFLLLVFFIYSMLIMAVHRGMKITLPTSDSAERENVSVLSLTVRTDGGLFLDRNPVTLAQLTELLKQKQKALEGEESPGLHVFAEATLAYQELYRVLDAVKASGVRKISLQARQEPSQ